MDGAFSPVATWMSRRDGLAFAAWFTACPQGSIVGAHFFGDFLCASKESYSPVATLVSYGVTTSRRAKKPTIRSRPVALFRPPHGCDFAQRVIDTGESLFLLVQEK